jgi:hypothetical protein
MGRKAGPALGSNDAGSTALQCGAALPTISALSVQVIEQGLPTRDAYANTLFMLIFIVFLNSQSLRTLPPEFDRF